MEDRHSDCWYAEHLKEQTCKDNFDFSDHIVLWVAHFLIPATMELVYSACHFFSVKGASLTLLIRFSATIISSIVLIFFALRGVLLTAMFFHTPTESIVGFLLVGATIVVPIYILAGKPYWRACIYGGVKVWVFVDVHTFFVVLFIILSFTDIYIYKFPINLF